MLKVMKFGGSSLADADKFRQIKAIVGQDPQRRLLVVSAPGKACPSDYKVTDLLYLCHAHVKYKVDYQPTLNKIKMRFDSIANELGLPWNSQAEFDAIAQGIEQRLGEAWLVSRGEYLCARLMALWLGWTFVDTRDCVFFGYDGNIDHDKTFRAIKEAWAKAGGNIVLPGFYGAAPGGEVQLMSRGGSDITGALAAAALEASMYENWTDVPGLLMADPGIVENPRPIPRITYNELRELTYMGARVLHEESVFHVRKGNIPINIRSTQAPHEPGTLISEYFEEDGGEGGFITGLAGKKDFSIISVRQSHVAGQLGLVRRVLELFQRREINVESMPSGIDGFSVVVSTEAVRPHIYSMMSEIEAICGEGSVKVTEGVALIAAVGRKMVSQPGIAGRLFGALGNHGVNIRLISQGTDELNIMLGVANGDFEKAIRVLYESFAG